MPNAKEIRELNSGARAAKDQPDWVKKVCRRWERESPGKETAYIVKRAQRSLK